MFLIDPLVSVCIISREKIYNLGWHGVFGERGWRSKYIFFEKCSEGVGLCLGKQRDLSHGVHIDLKCLCSAASVCLLH